MSHPLSPGTAFTGARARFSVKNVPIGYATNCTGGQEISYEPLKILDHISTVEHVPITYDVTFSASRVRLVGKSLRGPEFNLWPKVGDDDTEFLRSLLNPEFANMQAVIEDSILNQVFMLLTNVKITSTNWNITAVGVVGEDITFVATRMKDEAEVPLSPT